MVYRPELLKTTHAHLAKELENAGKPREAEEHFLGAEDWRGAVAAYRAANMWEDALRVARTSSGDKAAQQVNFNDSSKFLINSMCKTLRSSSGRADVVPDSSPGARCPAVISIELPGRLSESCLRGCSL